MVKTRDSLGWKHGTVRAKAASKSWDEFLDAVSQSEKMEQHPFDLETFGWTTGFLSHQGRLVHLFNSGQDGDGSLISMLAVAGYISKHYGCTANIDPYLRVSDSEQAEYYEMGCHLGIFLWCVLKSSRGGSSAIVKEAKEIFSSLAEAWGTAIKHVTLPGSLDLARDALLEKWARGYGC